MSINRSSLSPRITSFLPLGKICACRRLEEDTKAGQIVLPAYLRLGMMATFEVVSTGSEVSDVRPGMRALCPRQLTHATVEVNGTVLELIPSDQFAAIIGDDSSPTETASACVRFSLRGGYDDYEMLEAALESLSTQRGDTVVVSVIRGSCS